MAQKSIQDLYNDISVLKQKLLESLPNITVEYAENTTNLVIDDIQKRGILGKSYSTEPIYAGPSVFKNKSAFQPVGKNEEKPLKTSVYDIKSKKKKNIAIKGDYSERKTMYLQEGYQELRQINGLQVQHVDLTFTGRLLQNIRTQSVKQEEYKFTAVIGASQTEEVKKLSGQHKRFGNFLKPGEPILEITNQIPINRVKTIIESTLNVKIQ